MTTLLRATDIRVRYGHSTAVEGVSLEVAAGELLAIAGANGAGKTTLVNAVAGWSRGPAQVEGTVEVAGRDISRASAQQRARLGVALVPEAPSVFGQLTVLENLEMVSPAKGGAGKTYEVEDLMTVFPQLRDRSHARAATLSGGERQMVAIARALRAAPSLLILDEPSVGLAPRLVLEILHHIKALAAEGLAVLLVEQNVKAALEVADRLSLLEQGRVVATGTADEMRDDERTVRAYLGGLRS
jgi:branched-chain amino acid transport system ATP-binding protein